MNQIVISALPFQEFSCVLGGQNCVITLRQIAESLYCDLAVDGVQIFAGRRCCIGTDINCYPTPLFSGRLFFIDTLGKSDPQYQELNSRWLLVYEEAENAVAPTAN